jgi:phosphoglycerate dehydrogenase-like enzyme
MGWKVLVTARAFWVSGAEARQALVDAGCDVRDAPKAGPIPQPELIELLRGADAIVAASDPFDVGVFTACPDLRVVSRCGVGIDSVSLPDATAAGVIVTNTPGAITEAVGDYTFALMLGIARRIAEGDALMRSGGWGEYPGVLVWGKTLGLVGFGQIGRSVARRARGFNMRVLAYDPPAAESGSAREEFGGSVEFTDLETLLRESDYVSLHAPNLPETRRMFNAERFAQMKRCAYFINTARGALVDEAALADALEQGVIAGAAVDVYEKEPCPADTPLRSAPRCLLTPHNAFNAVEAAANMSMRSAENLTALIRGERPAAICNPEVLDSPALRWKV